MKKHPKFERSLVLLKPDAIQRGLVGEIIKRYEQLGFKLVAMKMLQPTPELIEKHYTLDPEWRMTNGLRSINGYKEKGLEPPHEDPMDASAFVLKKLVKYMSSGPIIAMVWQGAHAVQIIRKLTGSTEPLTSDVGTIRGDYVFDSYSMTDADGRAIRNLVHASGSPKEAEDEIKHWFKDSELMDYKLLMEDFLYGSDIF